MGNAQAPNGTDSDEPDGRNQQAQRATWVSVLVNLILTLLQLAIGWLSHSQSLIAHGLHSFSDLLSDFLVIYASRQSAHPADAEHPYGHARVETAATLLLGLSLVVIGAGILWESGLRLHQIEALPVVEWAALWAASATVVAKEALYRYLIAVARRLRSQLLTANALHTRADAASALVVVVGIAGALLGWSFLDLLAAALMGFMILRMGAGLAWGALQELIDTGLDLAQVSAIRETLLASDGVRGVHALRTRRMAHQALVDAHVQVDARISVSEGHRIAECVRRQVLSRHPEVLDVLVHIDPEDDSRGEGRVTRFPSRESLHRTWLAEFSALPELDRWVLHYVGHGLEVEIFVATSEGDGNQDLRQRIGLLQARLEAHPDVNAVHVYRCEH